MTGPFKLSKPGWLHWWSTVCLVLATLSPAFAPASVLADASGMTQSYALPKWWQLARSQRFDPLASSRALPSWWPSGGDLEAPAMRPAAAPINRIQIEDGLGTEIETHSMSADESFTFFAVGYTDGTPSSAVVTWTLAPKIGSLSTVVGVSTNLEAITATSGLLTATLVTTPTISATALVTVTPGDVTQISLSPANATIVAGESMTYTADGYDDDGNLVGDVTTDTTFSIESGASGSCSANVCTATKVGTWNVGGEHTSGANDTASLEVDPGPVAELVVSPSTVEMPVGSTQMFTATGSDAYGNAVGVAPDWETDAGSVSPKKFFYTVLTAQTTPAVGRLVMATENGVTANADVDIVHGPLDHFAITSLPVGAQIAGESFDITVEARDEYDNLVLDFDEPADLTDSTHTIAPPALPFAAGEANTSATITRAGSGVVFSVTYGVTTALSNAFTVDPNELDHIRVNKEAGNGGALFGPGAEMGDRETTIYGQITAWAGCFDAYDNYCGDVEATWGGTGVVGQGAFTPTVGISTTFTPAPILSGTGRITAEHDDPPLPQATSGEVHVKAPELAISKVGLPSPAPAGGFLQYTIDYANVGNAAAQGVRITETYDPRVTRVGGTPPDDGNNVWTPGFLAAGESDSIIVTVQVQNSLVPSTALTNVVTIGGLRLAQAAFTETTHVTSTSKLSMSLDASPDPVAAGGTLVYQLHYENLGNAPVSAVVTLTYDADVTFQGWSGDGSLRGGTDNVWDLGTVQAEEDGDISIVVEVDDYMEDQDDVNTSALIAGDGESFVAFASTTVRAPVLALSKSAAPSPVESGDPLVYTLVYSNVGHLATTGLVVTDAIPADTGFVSCQPAAVCRRSGDLVIWEPGTLAPGAKKTATMAVDVERNLDDGTLLTNTARVRVFNVPDYAASARITTVVGSRPSLWLSIGNGVEGVEAGEELAYTVRYTNTGNANAENTTIVVTPPSSQFVEDVGCVPSCAPSGGNLIYAIGTLPGGVSGSVLLTAKVKHPLPAGADSIVASAIIATSTPGDPSQGNAGQDVDLITTRPDLVVTADYEDVKPWPGKRVTYTIRYENLEPIATTLVTLTVKTHPDTEFQKKGSTGGWAEDGDNYYFYLPVLGYSQSGELVFVVTLTDTFSTETTDFDVTFEIDDSGVSGPDANPINNVYYAWLGVPDLVIEDVQVDPSVWAGEPGYVEVTVKNIGTGWACTIYNASGCFGFNLDPFLDPDEPPPSFPIKGFGDCYVEFPALPPGVARTAEISFTNAPRSQWPDPQPLLTGFCEAGKLMEIWLKVDNWNPDILPEQDGFSLVPESNEYNNVFGPVAPEFFLYLPLILERHP